MALSAGGQTDRTLSADRVVDGLFCTSPTERQRFIQAFYKIQTLLAITQKRSYYDNPEHLLEAINDQGVFRIFEISSKARYWAKIYLIPPSVSACASGIGPTFGRAFNGHPRAPCDRPQLSDTRSRHYNGIQEAPKTAVRSTIIHGMAEFG